jgi:hypothetical protein
MQTWADLNHSSMSQSELIYIHKIIGYLINDPEPMHDFTQRQLELDFVKFLQYYDRSSKQKYQAIYPVEFLEWIHTL